MAESFSGVLAARVWPRDAGWRRTRRLAVAFVTLVGVAVVLHGELLAATTPPAPSCGSTNVSVTSLNGPIYYTDSGASMDSQYVGFKLTNHESTISSLWASLGNFRGGSSTLIQLNSKETSAHSLGSVSTISSATAYWYTTDSSPSTETTTNPQYQDLTIYNGNPAAGGTAICNYTNTFTAVQTPITALANKVTNVTYGTPVLGHTFTVEQQGRTGTIGAGPSSDPGVFNMSPATSSSWPADIYQLQSSSVTFCATSQPCNSGDSGTTTFADALHIASMDTYGFGSQELYTAYFVFKVVGGTTSTTSVSPNVDIASGTQVKHTAPLSGIDPVPVPTNSDEYLSISAGTPTLTYPGGTDAYTVTPHGTAGLVYQKFTVTMPSGAVYDPGTSTWGSHTIANPSISGQTLTFTGPFTWDGSSTLQFTLNYPSSAGTGTFATSVTGLAGSVTIGASAGSSTAATTSITINKASITITALNQTITQGSTPTYGFAASGLVRGETVSVFDTSPTCSSTYVAGTSGAGSYTITCSGAADNDYTFTYATGTLTVLSNSGPSLSYDINGGTGTTPLTQTGTSLPYTVASSSGFSRSGYVFTGWNSASDGSGTSYQPGDQFTGSSATTLYAQWTALTSGTVTVTFNANGGSGSMSAETFTSGVAKALTSNAFTRTGFTFGGWSIVANGSQTYTDGQSITISGNLNLYAIWNASIQVQYDDSTNFPSSAQNCAAGTNSTQTFTYPTGSARIEAPSLTGSGALTTNGYACQTNGNSGHYDAFIGWNTSSSATTSTTTGWYSPGDVYSGSSSIKLYAIWNSSGSNGDSFLFYDSETGTGGPTVQDIGTTSPATLSSTVPTLIGYTFGGWCSTAPTSVGSSCTGTTYSSGGSYTFNVHSASLFTIYAIWRLTSYTLSYDANGGTGTTPSSSTFTITSAATVASGSGLSNGSATFLGWNTASNGSGSSYSSGDSFSIPASTTLYAQWSTTYVLTYSANGATSGSPPSAQIFSVAPVTVSGVGSLARTGYTFTGWNTSQDGSGTTYPAGSSYSTLASATLYALWVPANTYQVTYVANGATSGSAPSTQSFNGGSSVTIASNSGSLALSGKTFGGWNTASDGSGTSYASGVVYSTAANLTLYAVWLPSSTYQVSYMANNATSGSAPGAQTFSSGSVTIASNSGSLARTGYTFDGWNTAADGSGTAYPAGASYSTLANLTLYAYWVQIGSYEVVYSPNGADGGTAPATQTFSISSVTISSNTFARSGYTFIGWNTSADGSGTTYSPGDSYSTGANLNLYAQWVANSSYAVVYDPNGGSGSVATQTFGSGGSVTISSGSSLTKTGYTFNNWNTAADGSGTSYSAGTTYNTTANLTLYAQYSSVPYTVTYDANGGNNAPATQNFAVSNGDTISSGSGLTRSGYTFVGWNTASDGSGTSYATGDNYKGPANLYLYAQWVASGSYAVVYVANGGSGSVSTQTFTSGGSVTISGGSGYTRTGYTFASWNTAADNSGTTYAAGATYSTTASLTLYAHWTVNSYSVTYNVNGGSGSAPSTASFTVAIPATLASGSGLSRTSYTFSGWNTSTDGTGQTYAAGDSYGLPYNLTLYAKWDPTGDTVIFDPNGGSGSMSNESFTSGVAKALTSNAFTRSGYTWDRWNTANDGTGTSYTNGQSITISTGMTLYATWNAIATDTVTFKTNDGSSTYSSMSRTDGSSITLPSTEQVPTGYTSFMGWASSAGATSATRSPGASYTLSGSTTFYAVFSRDTTTTTTTTSTTTTTPVKAPDVASATIRFDSQGGSAVSSITGKVGSTITLPAAPTRAGYEFLGWFDVSSGGTTLGSGYKLSKSTTLYAQWKADKATITFDSQSGSEVPPLSGGIGSTITLPSAPTRAGYVFVGWFTAPSGGSPLASSYKLSGSATLYAQWKPVGEAPAGAGEVIARNGTVTKVPIRKVHGAAVVGTADYGLKIKTEGSKTTVAHATITLVRGSNAIIGGFGFKPGTIVHIYLFSKRMLVGVSRVRKNGTYSGSFPVPPGISDGRHSIATYGIIYTGQAKTVAAPVTVVSRSVTILIVPFDFNSSVLTPTLKAEVVHAAKTIEEYHVRSVTLTGFTDPRGSVPYNLALSRRRVVSVDAYLMKELRAFHYRARILRQIGLGKTHIVHAPNGTVENAMSRRVVITLEVGKAPRT